MTRAAPNYQPLQQQPQQHLHTEQPTTGPNKSVALTQRYVIVEITAITGGEVLRAIIMLLHRTAKLEGKAPLLGNNLTITTDTSIKILYGVPDIFVCVYRFSAISVDPSGFIRSSYVQILGLFL